MLTATIFDSDDYEYQQWLGEGGFLKDDPEAYDPTPLDRSYDVGDETRELFNSFWRPKRTRDAPIDPERYKGTRLYWHTLEEYRALNPRGPE